jgi:O-antigen ligase
MVSLFLFFIVGIVQHGLLFEWEYAAALGVLLLACVLVLPGKQQPRPLLLQFVWLAFAAIYLVSVTYAINRQTALFSALRYIVPIPIIWLAMRMTVSHFLTLFRGLFIACCVLVIFGFVLAQFDNQRFQGTLEYANTWGILLLALLTVGIACYVAENKWRYVAGCFLLATGIGLTESRTVIVLMLVTIPLLVISFGKAYRLPSFRTALAVLLGFVTSLLVTASSTYGIIGFGIGIIVVTLLHKGGKKLHLATGALLLSAAGFTILSGHSSSLAQRLFQTNLQAGEWVARLGYYHDAWKALRNSILLGYGGGSWDIVQFQYQTADYDVRFLHNQWLEIGIDSGMVGLLAYAAMIASVIYYAVIVLRKAAGIDRVRNISYLAAFLLLLAHSCVDITFNYPVMFGLWALFGCALASNAVARHLQTFARWKNYRVAVLVPASALLLGVSSACFAFAVSEVNFLKANQLPASEYTRALEYLGKSAALTPFPIKQHQIAAELSLKTYLQTQQSTALHRAHEEILLASKSNPDDVRTLLLKSQVEYTLGNREQAIQQIKQLRERFPFHQDVLLQYKNWVK